MDKVRVTAVDEITGEVLDDVIIHLDLGISTDTEITRKARAVADEDGNHLFPPDCTFAIGPRVKVPEGEEKYVLDRTEYNYRSLHSDVYMPPFELTRRFDPIWLKF